MSKYKTAQGKIVDMGALSTRHERTRAVGNMNVNARGDTLDSNNIVIKDNTKRVSKAYKKVVTETKKAPLVSNTPVVKEAHPVKEVELHPEEHEFLNDDDADFVK